MKVTKRVPIKKKKSMDHPNTIRMKPKSGNNTVTVIALILIIALGAGIFFYEDITSFLRGDEPIARVNDKYIYKSELDVQYAMVPAAYQEMFTRKVILDQMISQEVLLQKANELEVDISDEEMDRNMEDAIAQSGMTEEEFMAMLERQNTTIEELRNFYKVSLLIDKLLQQEVISQVEVTDDEVQEYYENNMESFYSNATLVEASHILISVNPDLNRTNESAYEIALDVRNQLLEGTNFTELALAYSDDESVTVNGGKLGYFARGDMVAPFETAAFEMEVGEISVPVQTRFGYHIIYKTGEQEPGYLPLDIVEQSIRAAILEEKQRVAVEEYIANLREKAEIEFLGEFKQNQTQPTGGVISEDGMDITETDIEPLEEEEPEVEDVVEDVDVNETDSSLGNNSTEAIESDADSMEQELDEIDSDSDDDSEMNSDVEDMMDSSDDMMNSSEEANATA
ncbi:MAG: peptidylprolyl isomerase [Candidatus Woesearchaeota archaeon]